MERYEGINFDKRRVQPLQLRQHQQIVVSVGGGYRWGDEIYFDEANPFLGREDGRPSVHHGPTGVTLQLGDQHQHEPLHRPQRWFFVPGLNEGERSENGEIFNVKIFPGAEHVSVHRPPGCSGTSPR